VNGVLPEKAPVGFGDVPGVAFFRVLDEPLDLFDQPGIAGGEKGPEAFLFFGLGLGHVPIIAGCQANLILENSGSEASVSPLTGPRGENRR
jgi:hypothetical protein